MSSSFRQDFPSQDLSNSRIISNPSANVPQIEFGQSNTQSLKRYFDETRKGENRFLTNFALSDNYVNKYNVGGPLNNFLRKQAANRSDGGIKATLNKVAGAITTSPIEMAAKSGSPITVIHNLRPNADLANRESYDYIRQQAKSGALGAYDLSKSGLVGNVLQHQKIASSDVDFMGKQVRDIYLDTQMYGSQTLNLPGFRTNALNQKYQDIYIRPKVLKNSIEDKALQKQINYIENAPIDSQGFKQLDPRSSALNYEAGFMISGSAIMERFSKELSRDTGSISDVILVSPSADFTEANTVYAQNPEMIKDLTAHKNLKRVGQQINALSANGAEVYRATGEGRMGTEIQRQAVKYGINIGDDSDPNKAYNPQASHSNIYSVIRKNEDGSIRPDSMLIVTTRRQTNSNTLESGFMVRFGDVSTIYNEKFEQSKTDVKIKADLYKQFGVTNDKDLEASINDISKGLGSQELMTSILKEVNYEYKFNKDKFGARALGSSRILRNYTLIQAKGHPGWENNVYSTGDTLAKQPLNLDQAIFDTYISQGRMPEMAPLANLYRAYTGEEAPTAVTEADKQITSASLGTQLNYQLGFNFYTPGLGIIGSSARLIGKTLDTLTGYHAYQREQAIIKHQQDDIKDLETGGRGSNYKAGPMEATITMGVEAVKGMTLSVLEYGALLGSTYFIKEMAAYGQEGLRAESKMDSIRNMTGRTSSRIREQFPDKVVDAYRAFGAKMQEGLLQGILDLVTPDISYKDKKLYNVIKARQKVIMHGAYVLGGEDGTTKIKSKQTKEYIAAVKEYNIQLNQFDPGALDELPNYDPTYEKLNTGLIGEEWAAEAERREVKQELKEGLQPVKGLLPTISEKIDSDTLINNQTLGTNRIRNIAQHFDMLTETISIPGLNWLIKPDYNPAQVKYIEDSSLSHVYGSSILSRSIANIALATRTLSSIAEDPFKHLSNVQSLFEKSDNLDKNYKQLLLEISHSEMSHIGRDTAQTIADDTVINKVYNFADESREFQQLAASNDFFHLGNDADKIFNRKSSMVALPTKMLAVGAGLFAADFLLDQFILRTQGVTLSKQLALFKEVRKEEGQVFNFEFNATASTSVMLGAGLVGGGTVATLLPTIKREHIGKIFDNTKPYSTGELANELEILKYNLSANMQNEFNLYGDKYAGVADDLKLGKINQLLESAEGVKNLQKYKFALSPTRFLIGAAVGMMATKLAYTMAAGALNFTYSEVGGINSSMAAISADKLTMGLESLLNENALLMGMSYGLGSKNISKKDIEKIQKDTSQPLYQRAVEVLGREKVRKIYDTYAYTMEKAGSVKFVNRALYAEAEMVDAMIKKYRTPLPKKQGQSNYTFAFQSTSGFIQFATVSRYNESTGKSSINFGVQLLPTMGIGASPVLPFGLVNSTNNKSNLKELEKTWSKQDAERKGGLMGGAFYESGRVFLENTLGVISYEKRNIVTPALMFLGSTSIIGALYSKTISKDVIKYTEDSSYKPFIKAVEKISKLPRSLTGGVLALTHATVASFNSAIIASLEYLDAPSQLDAVVRGTKAKTGSFAQIYKTSSKVILPFVILGAAYALTDPYEGIDTLVSNKKKESGAVFLDPLNRATAVVGLAAGTYKLATDLGVLGTKYNADLRNLPIIGTQIGRQQDVIYRELINKVNPATENLVESTAKKVLSGAHYPNIIRVGKAKAELAALGLFTVVMTSKVIARAIGNIGGAEALEQVYNTPFASILRVLSGVEESEFQLDITSSKSKFNRRKAEYKDPNQTFLQSTVFTLSDLVQSATLGFVDIKKVTGFYKDTPNLFVPALGPQGYSYNDETGDFKSYQQYNESGVFDVTFAASSMFKGGMDIVNYQEAIKFLELDVTNIKAGNFRLVTKLNKYFNTRMDRMKIQGMFTTYELNALRGKQALSLAFSVKIHKATNLSYQRPSDLLNNLIESSYRAGNIEGTFAKPDEILFDVFDTMDILNLPIFSRTYKKEGGNPDITAKVPMDVQSLLYGYANLGATKEFAGNTGFQANIGALLGTPREISQLFQDKLANAPVLGFVVLGFASAITGLITASIMSQAAGDLIYSVTRKYQTGMHGELHVDENLKEYKEVDEMVKAYKVAKHGDFVLTTGAKSPPRTIVLTPELLKEYRGSTKSVYKDDEALKRALKGELKGGIAELQEMYRRRAIQVLGIDDYLTKGAQSDIKARYLFTVEHDTNNILFSTAKTNVVKPVFIIDTVEGVRTIKLADDIDSFIKTSIVDDFQGQINNILNKKIGSGNLTLGSILFKDQQNAASIVDQAKYTQTVKDYLDELTVRYNNLIANDAVDNQRLQPLVNKLNAEFSQKLTQVERNIIKHQLFAKIGVELPSTELMGTFGQLDDLSKYYKFSQSRPTINLLEDTLGAGGTFAGTYLTRYRFTYGVAESLAYLYSSDEHNKERAAKSLVTNLTYEILGLLGGKLGMSISPALTAFTKNEVLSNILGASAGIALIAGVEIFKAANVGGSRKHIKQLERQALDISSRGVMLAAGLTKSIMPFSEQISDSLVRSVFHPLGMKIQQKALDAYMSGNASIMIWNLLLPESMYKQLADPVIDKVTYGDKQFEHFLMKANALQRDIYYKRKFYQEGVLRYGEESRISSVHKNMLGQATNAVDYRAQEKYGKYLPKYNLSPAMRIALERRDLYDRFYRYGAGTHKFRKSGENQLATLVNQGYSISYIAGVRANASFLTNLMLELDDFNNYLNKGSADLHKQFVNSTRLRTVLAEGKIYAGKVKKTLLNAKGIDIIGVSIRKEQVAAAVEEGAEEAVKESVTKTKFSFGMTRNMYSKISTSTGQIMDGFGTPISKLFNSLNDRIFAVVNDLGRGAAYLGVGIIQLLKKAVLSFDDIGVGLFNIVAPPFDVNQYSPVAASKRPNIVRPIKIDFQNALKNYGSRIGAATNLIARLAPSFLAVADVIKHQTTMSKFDFGFSFRDRPFVEKGKKIPEGFEVKDAFRSLSTSAMTMLVGGMMQFMGFGFISTLMTSIIVTNLFGNPIADFYANKSLRERENESGFLLGLNAVGALLQVITNLRDVSMPRLVGTNLTVKEGKVTPDEKLRQQTQNRADNAFGIRKHIAIYELEMLKARSARVDTTSIGVFDTTFSYLEVGKPESVTKSFQTENALIRSGHLSRVDTAKVLQQITLQAKRAAMDAFKKSKGEMSNLDYEQRYYTELFIRLNALETTITTLTNTHKTKKEIPSIIKNIVRTLEDTSIMVSREGVVVKPSGGKGKKFFGFHYSFALHDTIMGQIDAENAEKRKAKEAAKTVTDTIDGNTKSPVEGEEEEEVTEKTSRVRTGALHRTYKRGRSESLTAFFTTFQETLPEYYKAAEKVYNQVDQGHVAETFKKANIDERIPILIIDTETISTTTGSIEKNQKQALGESKGALISQYASLQLTIGSDLKAIDIEKAELTELTIKPYWGDARQEFLSTQADVDKLGTVNANARDFVIRLNKDLTKVVKGEVALVGHNIKSFDLIAIDQTLAHLESITKNRDSKTYIQETRALLNEIRNPSADSIIVVVDTLDINRGGSGSVGAVSSTDNVTVATQTSIPVTTIVETTTLIPTTSEDKIEQQIAEQKKAESREHKFQERFGESSGNQHFMSFEHPDSGFGSFDTPVPQRPSASSMVEVNVPNIGKVQMSKDTFDKVTANIHKSMLDNHYRGEAVYTKLFMKHYYDETKIELKSTNRIIENSKTDFRPKTSIVFQHHLINQGRLVVLDASEVQYPQEIQDTVNKLLGERLKLDLIENTKAMKAKAYILKELGIDLFFDVDDFIPPTLETFVVQSPSSKKEEFKTPSSAANEVAETINKTGELNTKESSINQDTIVPTSELPVIPELIPIPGIDGDKKRPVITISQEEIDAKMQLINEMPSQPSLFVNGIPTEEALKEKVFETPSLETKQSATSETLKVTDSPLESVVSGSDNTMNAPYVRAKFPEVFIDSDVILSNTVENLPTLKLKEQHYLRLTDGFKSIVVVVTDSDIRRIKKHLGIPKTGTLDNVDPVAITKAYDTVKFNIGHMQALKKAGIYDDGSRQDTKSYEEWEAREDAKEKAHNASLLTHTSENVTTEAIEVKTSVPADTITLKTSGSEGGDGGKKPPKRPTSTGSTPEGDPNINNSFENNDPFKHNPPGVKEPVIPTPPKRPTDQVLPATKSENIADKDPTLTTTTSTTEENVLTLTEGNKDDYSDGAKTKADRKLQTMLKTMFGAVLPKDTGDTPDTLETTDIPKFNLSQQINYILNKAHTAGIDVIGNFLALPGFFTHGGVDLAAPDTIDKIPAVPEGTRVDLPNQVSLIDKGFHTLDIADTAASVYLISRGAWNLGRYLYMTMFEDEKNTKEEARAFTALSNHEASLFQGFIFSSTLAALGSSKLTIGTGLILGHIAGRLGIDVSFGFYKDYSEQLANRQEIGLHNLNYGAYSPGMGYLSLNDAFNTHRTGQLGKTLSALIELRVNKFTWANRIFRAGTRGLVGGTLSYLLLEKLMPSYNKVKPELNQPLLVDFQGIKLTRNQVGATVLGGLFASNTMRKLALGKIVPIVALTTLSSILFENLMDSPDNAKNNGANVKYFAASSYITALLFKAPLIKSSVVAKGGILGIATWATFTALTNKDITLQQQGTIVASTIGVMSVYYAKQGFFSLPILQKPLQYAKAAIKAASKLGGVGIYSLLAGGLGVFLLNKTNTLLFKDSNEALKSKYAQLAAAAVGTSVPLLIGAKGSGLKTSFKGFNVKDFKNSAKSMGRATKVAGRKFIDRITTTGGLLGALGAITGYFVTKNYFNYAGEKDEMKRERAALFGGIVGGTIGFGGSLLVNPKVATKLNLLKEKTASVFSIGSAKLNRIAAASRLAQGKMTKGLIFGGILYAAFGSSFRKPKDYGGIKLNTVQNQALGLGVSALAGEAIAFGGFPLLKAMKYNSLMRASGIGAAVGLLNYFNRTSANRNDNVVIKSTLSAIAGSAAAFITTDKVQKAIVKAITSKELFGLSKEAIARVIKIGGYGVIGTLSALAIAPTVGKFVGETFDPKTSTTKKASNITLMGALGIIGAGEFSNYKNAKMLAEKNLTYVAPKANRALFSVGIGLLATSLTLRALEDNKKMTQRQKGLIAAGVGVATTGGATYLQLGKPILNKWIGRAGLGAVAGALTYSQLSPDLDKKTRIGASLGVMGLVSLLGMESVRNTLSKFVEPASQAMNLAMLGYNTLAFIKDSKVAGAQDKYREERKQQRSEAAGSLGFSAADLTTNVATMLASGSAFNISLGLSGVFTGLTISLMTKAINRRNTKDIMSIMNRFGTKAEAKRAREMDTQRSALQGAADSFRGSGIALYGVRGKSGVFMANKIGLIKGANRLQALVVNTSQVNKSLKKALEIISNPNTSDDVLEKTLSTLVKDIPDASAVRAVKETSSRIGIWTTTKTTNEALKTGKTLIPGVKGTQASYKPVNSSVAILSKQINKVNNALNTARTTLETLKASGGDSTQILKQQNIVESLEKTLVKANKFQAQVASTAGETAEEGVKGLKLVRALNNPVVKTGLKYLGGIFNLATGVYESHRAGQAIKTLDKAVAEGKAGQLRVKDFQAAHGAKAQGNTRAFIGGAAIVLGLTAGVAVAATSLPALAVIGIGILTGLAVVAAQEAFIQYVADPFGRGFGAHRFDKTRKDNAEETQNAAKYGTELDGATGLSWFSKKIRQFGDNTFGRLGYAASMLMDKFSANSNEQGKLKEKPKVDNGNPISNFFNWLGSKFNQSSVPGGVKAPKGRKILPGQEIVVASAFTSDMGMYNTGDFQPVKEENGVSRFFRGLTNKVKSIFTNNNTLTDNHKAQQQQFEADNYEGFSFLMPYGQEGTREMRDKAAYSEYLASGAGNTKKGNVLKRFFGWVSDGTKENLGRARNTASKAWQGAKSIGASVGEGISNVFQTAKNKAASLLAGAAGAVAGMFGGGYEGTVIGSWDIEGFPGIKQYVSRLQTLAPQHFNNTLRGYAATVLAVQIMMQEFPTLGREKQSDPNIFFTAMGGAGNMMRGAAQFATTKNGGWGPKTDTPEKYANTLGTVLHTWKTGAESAPYTTGKSAVDSFLDVRSSIKTSQQLNDWMRSIGMGGGERVGGYYRNSWQGLTKVNTKNMTPLDPLLNFEVITSGVGQVSFGGGGGQIGTEYEYYIKGQSAMGAFNTDPDDKRRNSIDSANSIKGVFKKYGVGTGNGGTLSDASGFGYSSSRGRPHRGFDIGSGSTGDPAYSRFALAEVVYHEDGTQGGYGGVIEVFELDASGRRTGYSDFYAHVGTYSRKFANKRVSYGEQVALSDETGGSRGIHHHIEFRYNGKQLKYVPEGALIAVINPGAVELRKKGGGATGTPLSTSRAGVAPPLIRARVGESTAVKDWKVGNNTKLGTLYLASGHEVDDATGTPGEGGGSFKYRGRVRTMESALNLASRDLIYNYLISMGFDVKLISPQPGEITSSGDEDAQKAARTKYYDRIKNLEAAGNQVLELHHDRYDSLGRSGVIAPIHNPKISMLDAALAESYGKFSQLVRGKDGLATTRRGMSILELGAANAGIIKAFKNYLKGNKAEFESFMKWHATQIGNAMIKAGASRKTSSATLGKNSPGLTTASTYTPDKSVASNIQPNSVEATVQAKAEIIYGLDKDINVTAMNVANQNTVNADGVIIKASANATTVAMAPKPSVRVVDNPVDTSQIAAIPNKKVTVAVTKSDGSTETTSGVPMDVKYQEMFIHSATIFNPDYIGLDPTLDAMIISGDVFV